MLRVHRQIRQVHDITVRNQKVIHRQGPGGRSSNDGITATVFGATGFVGRNLVNQLGKRGTTIVTPYRGTDDDRRHLRVMADLGKLVQLQFDIRDDVSIVENLRHSDIVYNVIGRNFETKNFSFDQVHHQAARKLAKLARENGVQKFVHVSALGADVDSPSAFLRSKALGEIAVKEEFPDATIVRPSWIYGYEDRFWNKMGWFAKWAPYSLILAPNGGKNTMRPVFVNDVAAALATMTKEDQTVGKLVELYGPKTYTYAKLIELFQDAAMRQNRILPLPKEILKPICALWSSVLAFPIMSADEIERLALSDKFQKGAYTFEDFGILPHTAEETVHRFARLYRDGSFSDAPFEPLVKDYTFKGQD